MNTQLKTHRNQLDTIDAQLVHLLARRFSITRKIGAIKAEADMPVVDKHREAQQLQRIVQLANTEQINPKLCQTIMCSVIDEVVQEHLQTRQAKVPKSTLPTIGIIGQGDFGSFLAKALAQHAHIRCFDTNPSKLTEAQHKSSLQEVLQSQFVILAVPFNALESTLCTIRPHLKSTCTLIDVCSVKVESQKIFQKLLPKSSNVVFTHPLFGPQSASNGLAGHTVIFTNPRTKAAKKVMHFCHTRLGLHTIAMSASAHDKAMAQIHALTFFLARGLHLAKVAKSQFQTPSFQMILDLVALDAAQSQELFLTVELANPFAKEARTTFLTQLNSLHAQLSQQDKMST